MQQQDYHNSLTADITPEEAFDKISSVSEWWGTNFEGQSRKLNDIFTVRFSNGDMYKIKIVEVVPNQKAVWQLVDSNQTWHEDSTEWTGTKIVWEISARENATQIEMTHVGLVPSFECYDKCNLGWNYLIQKSLFKFITENQGLPA